MSFPIYPPNEIIDALQAQGLTSDFGVEDIAKPTGNKMMAVYEWFLLYFTMISRQNIREAVTETLLNIHHPELYEYRLTAGTFKDTFIQILPCASIYDFSDRDLVLPAPERVRYFLSGLINFTLFELEESELSLRPLEKGLEDLQLQREQLLRREAELMEQNAMMRQRHEEEEMSVAELIPQIETLRSTILDCKETEGPLDQRRTELHESRKAIAEQNRNAVTELQRLEAEINRLSTRVARSPEKVRSAIESLQKTLSSELASIASLEHNSRILEQKIMANDKYEKDLAVCIKLADEWESEMSRGAEVSKNLGILTDEYETQLPELQEVEKKTAQAQRRTELLEEQLERAHSGIQRKRQAAKERHIKAVERHEAILEAQIEHQREMEQQLNLKAHLIAQTENLIEDYTRGMKKGQIVFDSIRTELLHFTMKHQASINAIEAKLPLPPEDR